MNTPSKDYVIQASMLCKSFHNQNDHIEILQNINLSIEKGSSNAIVGVSGSGKTTLLAILASLDLPSSGSLKVLGKDLFKLTSQTQAHLLKEIGFIFQDYHLLDNLTALENIMLPLELHDSKNVKKKAITMLQKVGLIDRKDMYPSKLSGGEKQRLSIARAYVTKPKILFADEPTGNLDEENKKIVMDMLLELNKEYATTLIIVTHDQEVAKLCQSTYQLKHKTLQ